jgi:hypothetical protein
MADKEQTEGISQKEQVFLDRIGIVLRGAKQIAAYMGVSPATIVRWRRRFRGREEIRLCFPAFLVPTGRGHGLKLWSHTASIKEWVDRWSQIDCAEAQKRARWKRRTPRMKREGETRKELGGRFEGGDEQAVREAAQIGPTTPEPVKLDITLPETPAVVTKEPRAGFPPTPPPNPALSRPDCSCGTLITCIAHD